MRDMRISPSILVHPYWNAEKVADMMEEWVGGSACNRLMIDHPCYPNGLQISSNTSFRSYAREIDPIHVRGRNA